MITKDQIVDAAIKARNLSLNTHRLQPDSEFVSWDFFNDWQRMEELASDARFELWDLVDAYMKENPDDE